jgi:predicted ribosomally synthesized peptide with SipW-like signal peptide
MRRKESDEKMKSKMAALFASVLIALAVVGFTYAWWTETLTISGSVETGKLEVKFKNPLTTSCSSYMSCSAAVKDSTSIEVNVTNGYPCGWCNVTFTIENTGTIPAKVTAINIPTVAGLEISIADLEVGDIIPVGGSVSPTLQIHVADGAAETTTYTFIVTIEFGQFSA